MSGGQVRNNPVFRRFADIFLSMTGLLITAPLLIFIALAIKAEDGGPVLFRQERIGRFGRRFILLKFRSMSVVQNPVKQDFEPGNKSRITKTGAIIRKTKLDELPQLINILCGSMSFVGPRPEVEYWVAKYPDRWKLIHQVRPGLTDNASLEFLNEEEILAQSSDPEKEYEEIILPRKLDLYEDYVKNNSFVTDIKIIFLTIYALVTGKSFTK